MCNKGKPYFFYVYTLLLISADIYLPRPILWLKLKHAFF